MSTEAEKNLQHQDDVVSMELPAPPGWKKQFLAESFKLLYFTTESQRFLQSPNLSEFHRLVLFFFFLCSLGPWGGGVGLSRVCRSLLFLGGQSSLPGEVCALMKKIGAFWGQMLKDNSKTSKPGVIDIMKTANIVTWSPFALVHGTRTGMQDVTYKE
ncbi:hypothetical protein Cgig2_023489 [Carnegiea gigantea]|uniref:Uncharacterized protein n=1 Tax=Carnegiea gigantea TaxID=171969 RepID=A0A9Q1JVW6_9CARY|nr:hypothetical protein Cgig2_023489 [Carnegiea gigantea]